MKSFVIYVALSLAIATANGRVKYSREEDDLQEIVQAGNELGFKIIKTLSQEQGNTFFSPISISMLMGLVYSGSKNATATEIQRALNYPPEVAERFKILLDIIQISKEKPVKTFQPYQLEMANAMLVDKSFNILSSYKEQSRTYFDAAVESVSFSLHPEAAVESVNGWVAWKTRNKIPKLLDKPLEPLTKLFLMNVVYFKGTWKLKFDQRLTTPDTFYNDGRIPKTVAMMRQKRKLRYGFNSKIQGEALELPYSGDRIYMLLLLPEKRDGLADMEKLLSEEVITNISSNLRSLPIQVTLPRFSYTAEYNLIPILKNLGIQTLFNASSVDLGGISSTESLYVSKVLHKCAIQVDEEGGEATVVTGVSAGVRTGGPLVPLFTADHPFLFFIRDRFLNLTLFIGRVTHL
ncbi:intracellular coagulation inhibitor 1 [Parasteatoda tepidariorum]|nr:intracellular coagulation inhibitor 1 [Parasteatoda tepidariorum]